MKTRFLAIVAAALVAAAVLTPRAAAQAYTFPLPGNSASQAFTADDTAVAIYCKYIGTGAGGFVTVSAGNVVFESPDTSTADTTIECPVSGGLGGIFDTTNAACDTVDEFIDLVNTSSSNFRCFAHGLLGTDSTNTRFQAAADQNATAGYGILIDTSTAFETPIVIAPVMSTAEWLNFYMGGPESYGAGSLTPGAQENPWQSSQAMIFAAIGVSTYASGTSLGQVFSVKPLNRVGTAASSETVTALWSEVGGATTVAKTFNAWGTFGIYGRRGEKLLFKLKNSAAQATVTLTLSGQQFGFGRQLYQ